MKITIYKGDESRTIPAVDFGGAWIAQGWTTEPQPEPVHKPTPSESTDDIPTQPLTPALALLNSVTSAEELEVLPSVGAATARTLLERRPEHGYLTLDAAEELNKDKTHIQWEAIALWEG